MPKFYWSTKGTKTAGTVVNLPVTVVLLIVCALAVFAVKILKMGI
jgi:hypothetical protein